jgi:phospholipid-binding lipoprotein MlaA
LQGDGEQASKTICRFFINTIFGFFGTFDVASKMVIAKKDTDFGETLKKWGVGSTPFIVLPLFGPTSLRGGLGVAFSMQLDPIARRLLFYCKRRTRNRLYYAFYGTDLLSKRAGILYMMEELEKASKDMYITTRNAVMQMER